jgi:pimeloyl-ACP methyl ester carboxylesterase
VSRAYPWLVPCLLAAVSAAAPAGAFTGHGAGDVLVADNVRIHYVERGNDNAHALMLIPGWGMDASIWDRQIAEFARTHRVVAIDPRSAAHRPGPVKAIPQVVLAISTRSCAAARSRGAGRLVAGRAGRCRLRRRFGT